MVAAAIGASVVAGVATGAMSANASKHAADKQAQAAEDAAHLQNDQWNQTQANLKPYMDFGSSAINPLQSAMGYNSDWSVNPNNALQQKFTAPTADQAAQTPGYQFTQTQGLKSVQNSAAARGLGASGAAMKGAASYATGLADSTYNDVFNRALQTFNTNYSSAANNANRLSSIVGSGQNAAATNGSLGAQAATNMGNDLMSAGNARASGIIGANNAWSGAINNAASSIGSYGLLANNAGGGSGAGVPGWSPSTSAGNGMSFGV